MAQLNAAVKRLLDRTLINHLDTELRMNPAATRRIGAYRLLAYFSLAAAALLVPGLPSPRVLFVLMTLASIVEFSCRQWAADAHIDVYRQLTDWAIIVTGVIMAPVIWPVALVYTVGNFVWSALFPLIRGAGVMAGLVSAIIMAVAVITDQPSALAMSAATGIIMFVFGQAGRSIRRQLEIGRQDIGHALSAGGAIVHLTSLTSNSTIHVMGPVKQVTGYTREEWVRLDHHSLIHPDDLAGYWIDLDTAAVGKTTDRKCRFRHKHGHWIWLRDVSRVVEEPDGSLLLRGFSTEITELIEATTEVQRRAHTDSLTGLPNRAAVTADLERRIASGEHFTLMFLDLNRFKEINDVLGHDAGDQVLCAVADRLLDIQRAGDMVARMGGDEFAVVIGGMDVADHAETVAARLAISCRRPMFIDDVSVTSTPAIGIAVHAGGEATVISLLRRADMAMYESKRDRQRYVTYSREIESSAHIERTLRLGIRDALNNNEFQLLYQPKVNMITGEIYGVEALARWNHPEFGLLTPDRFIDLVTFSDEGIAFAEHTISEAVRFAATTAQEGTPISVAVNISARSLFDESLPDRTISTLRHYGVPANKLVFELTEQDIMEEVNETSSVLQRLHEIGVRVSIDDFGTGYSSLSRLIDLPVDEVKIDRRFVSAAPRNNADRVAVSSIIDLAGNLGLDVVAEGVENVDEAALLVGLGCEQCQGYLYGRPMSATDVLAVLAEPVPQHLLPKTPTTKRGHLEGLLRNAPSSAR